jgi:hypothetical protein
MYSVEFLNDQLRLHFLQGIIKCVEICIAFSNSKLITHYSKRSTLLRAFPAAQKFSFRIGQAIHCRTKLYR